MPDSISRKPSVLIVDDSAMNRALLDALSGEDYITIEAANGVEGVAELQKHGSEVSLVLLDIVMPEMDGFGVLEIMNSQGWIKDTPVIMVSSENSSQTIERAYDLGVTDFISRPFDANIVRRRVANTIMLYAKQKELLGMVVDQVYEREKTNNLMISILSHTVEFRNGESGAHVLNVQSLTEILLRHMMMHHPEYGLTADEISLIGQASALHDIGKIAIPEEVLNKPGRLTEEEFALMKTHSLVGAQMLDQLEIYKDEPLIKHAYAITRWHHERYDGRGYPDGLVGEDIPISAQVVSIADVYDALTAKRVYKDPIPHERALEMIYNGECGAFNPSLLECLREVADTLQDQLGERAAAQANEQELRNLVESSTRTTLSDGDASSRTLDQMEFERMKYQFFASMSNEIQYEYNADSDIMIISNWNESIMGLDEVVSNPLHDGKVMAMFGEENLTHLDNALRATDPENPVIKREMCATLDGKPRWFHVLARAIWTGEDGSHYSGSIGKLIDIHESHERMQSLQHKVSHDGLTGLVNQDHAREAITQRMARNPEGTFALVVLDLDRFKKANDTYGHQFGDKVLEVFAGRLRESVRDDDVVARVGGDEFLICMEINADPHPLIERIYNFLEGDFEGFHISASMGIACTEADMRDYDRLFHRADHALYEKKRSGRGGFVFWSDIDGSADEDYQTTLTPICGAEE